MIKKKFTEHASKNHQQEKLKLVFVNDSYFKQNCIKGISIFHKISFDTNTLCFTVMPASLQNELIQIKNIKIGHLK